MNVGCGDSVLLAEVVWVASFTFCSFEVAEVLVVLALILMGASSIRGSCTGGLGEIGATTGVLGVKL